MSSIVEMQEAQHSLAPAMGDGSLVASLRSLEVGGQSGAEFRTIRALGKHSGIRAKDQCFYRPGGAGQPRHDQSVALPGSRHLHCFEHGHAVRLPNWWVAPLAADVARRFRRVGLRALRARAVFRAARFEHSGRGLPRSRGRPLGRGVARLRAWASWVAAPPPVPDGLRPVGLRPRPTAFFGPMRRATRFIGIPTCLRRSTGSLVNQRGR